MKFILVALTLFTAVSAKASLRPVQELGTVDAWSNWYKAEDQIDPSGVCYEVLTGFQAVNAGRPYLGELVENIPVGFKQGTHTDGKVYYAVSCRIRVYRSQVSRS